MKLSDRVKNAGINAGQNCYGRMVRTADVVEEPEIKAIFKIHDNTLESVVGSMKENGFDRAEPIVLWKGKNCVVDGHTRLEAARKTGIEEIPVIEKEFEDVYAAILYTFERQANRRNLEQGEILSVASTLQDKAREARDGSGRGAEILAKKLGVSASTIYKAKRIRAEADEEDLKAVQEGKTTINKVYKKIERKERASEETGKKSRSQKEAGGGEGRVLYRGRVYEANGRSISEAIDEAVLSETIREAFILNAVELLVIHNQNAAAGMLAEHFIPADGRNRFYGLLPDAIRKTLEALELREENESGI
jgi:ParB family chromosome partitioning protein